MDEFHRKMPKIELHAHLNGSISPNTLVKLIDLHQTLGTPDLPGLPK